MKYKETVATDSWLLVLNQLELRASELSLAVENVVDRPGGNEILDPCIELLGAGGIYPMHHGA